ncbi:uncharacterized protein HD556DRAFT_1441441 [Suillus plorans]|uniref:Uncharacterized protein n=1 Tax=Suillus plorans TaxID=116603 RepID=A0A9P7DK06_9AGAM|nr:uncharacterized protein HD556DRAFT_1441441 [Suillus plorans]KAG1796742.1 hypothetical protein HD556DRAFT_1441441 [Suillus plorans]
MGRPIQSRSGGAFLPTASTSTPTSSPSPTTTGSSSTPDTAGPSPASDAGGTSSIIVTSSTINGTSLIISASTTPTTVVTSLTSPQSSAEQNTSSSSSSTTTTTTTTTAAAASTSSGNTTSSLATSSTNVNTGAIAGGVIGGVVVLVLLVLGLILYRRRRKHVAPSSEFAETIKRGEMPVLRLDSGVEIVPSWARNNVPLPLQQDSYYTSPAMSNMKLLDGMGIGGSDEQSTRFSLEKSLQPLRRSGQQGSDESMAMGNMARRVSSIGSSQEFWSRDTGKFDTRKDYRSISPLPTDTNYAPLMQNTYPMEPSRAVETLQNAYADLWELSVVPLTRPLPDLVRNGADTQPLPPLRPVRPSVDIGIRRKV